MIGQKQILQQEDSSITAEINHHLELCHGSHLSIIKGTINYHDHPKFGFCFKENLPHFLCMKGITGLVWREGSEDKTRKDRYNIVRTGILSPNTWPLSIVNAMLLKLESDNKGRIIAI